VRNNQHRLSAVTFLCVFVADSVPSLATGLHFWNALLPPDTSDGTLRRAHDLGHNAGGGVLAEALIRQMNRRFTPSASDTQKIRTVRNLSKLQAALDEIIEANATRESVLRQLE